MNFLINGFESIAPRLGMTLTHSLWEGAAVAIALTVALRFLRDKSAVMRYAAGCGAMGLFVVMVIATFALLAPETPRPGVVVAAAKEAGSIPRSTIAAPLPLVVEVPRPHESIVSVTPVTPPDPMRLAGFAWLMGASAVSLWHLAGWFWIRRSFGGRDLDAEAALGQLKGSLGIRRTVRLIETARLSVPAVVGVIWPVILIPLGFVNDLTPQQVEAILLHELAHIRRHDYLVNLLQVIVESLLFYHPATWWISAQIRRERENCCDDIAASRFTAGGYVSALLALEQRRWPMSGAIVAANGGSLLERVQRLLGRGSRLKRRPVRSAIAAVMVLACIGLPVAMQGCDKSKPSGGSPTASSSTPAAAVAADVNVKSEGITPDDLTPDLSVERIGPGDLVEVVINDLVGTGIETTKRCRVSDPGGTIAMPLVNGIKVAGLTEAEAQKAVATAYAKAQIISNPQVSLFRVENRSTTYTVLGGGVVTPGEFSITGSTNRLTNALVCGNVRLYGQKTILISRKTKESATRTLKISVAELMAGDSKVNVFLRPGDVIMMPPLAESPSAMAVPSTTPAQVPDPGQYYIGGNQITRGGVYAIPPGSITLKQAIIAAGGAEHGFAMVVRRDGDKESLVFRDGVPQLNSNTVPDLTVHAGDTITVSSESQIWNQTTTQQAVTP